MDRTGRQITKIAREVNKLVIQQMKEENVGTGEMEMIHFIRHHEGCSLKEVADALGIDKSAVTRRAVNLEKKGLIYREASKSDGRSVCLYAMQDAEGLKNRKQEVESEFYEWLIEDLDESEKEQFISLLNRCYARSKRESRNGFKNVKERLEKTNE